MISLIRFIFSITLIIPVFSQAQNLWINALPMAYNPSFAGSATHARIATNNTYGLGNIGALSQKDFINQNYVSFDKFISKLSAGIGVGFRYTNFGTNSLSIPIHKGYFFEESIAIAPKFSRKGKYTLSPSIQFNYNHGSQDYFDLVFHDTLDNGPFRINHRRYTLKSGLMFNSKKFFIGFSFVWLQDNHYQYNSSGNFLTGSYPAHLITGYNFRKSDQSDFSFMPVLLLSIYKNMAYIDDNTFSRRNGLNLITNSFNENVQANIYFTAKYKKITAGFDLSKNVMLGFEAAKLRIMLVQRYSNTFENPRLYLPGKMYSAQLSLRYVFGDVTSVN